MKRVVVLLAAAMLMAAPAFAGTTASQTAKVYTGAQQQTKGASNGATNMQGNISQTTVQGSTILNSGQDNTANIGGIHGSNGAQMKGNIDQTTVQGSHIINSGKGNEINVGGITGN